MLPFLLLAFDVAFFTLWRISESKNKFLQDLILDYPIRYEKTKKERDKNKFDSIYD